MTLIVLSWTLCLGQSGNTGLTCYTHEELKRIVNRVIYARECEYLLDLTEQEVQNKNSEIRILNEKIAVKDSTILLTDSINSVNVNKLNLTVKQLEVKDKEAQVLERKLTRSRIGWVSTGVGMLVLLILSLF